MVEYGKNPEDEEEDDDDSLSNFKEFGEDEDYAYESERDRLAEIEWEKKQQWKKEHPKEAMLEDI